MTTGTRIWVEGVLRAVFSGMANVFGVMLVDPEDFNLSNTGNIAKIAVVFGLVQLVQFLSQKPLPDAENPSAPRRTALSVLRGTGDGSGPPSQE